AYEMLPSLEFRRVLFRSGEPPPEVAGIVERLADQRRADDAVLLGDQAAIRLRWKEELGEPGEAERIGEPREKRQKDEKHDGGAKIGSASCRARAVATRGA